MRVCQTIEDKKPDLATISLQIEIVLLDTTILRGATASLNFTHLLFSGLELNSPNHCIKSQEIFSKNPRKVRLGKMGELGNVASKESMFL